MVYKINFFEYHMKAYRFKTNTIITPFMEDASESIVGFKKLREYQDTILKEVGIAVIDITDFAQIDDSNFILFFDNVYFTRRCIRYFLNEIKKYNHSVQLAIPDSLFIKKYEPLQELKEVSSRGKKGKAYNIFFIKEKSDLNDINNIRPAFIKFREIIYRQPIPPNMFGKKFFEQPITTSIAFHINHWVNLLNANQMEIVVKWVEYITSHPFKVFTKLTIAIFAFLIRGLIDTFRLQSISSAFSKGVFINTIMRWFNIIGKNCEIHPSAILEFAIIGDNVKIGPQSYIRASVINNDVIIEEKTKITFSIIDKGCYISQITILNGVVAYPDGDVCIDGMQFCLSGRNVKLTGLARPMDLKYGGRISVLYKKRPVAVNLEILGSCFGHRCFIGPDIYIAPGREIPNDTVIVPRISEVLYKIPEYIKPGVPMVIENGTLVESSSEKQ
ncbi:MAG: hypothetical protein N2746_00690 [Deltaproteobacteria bacterium]|nr:hypothetical protein [Deltaproteobacteria bacterium]